jgi:hypothetical protein
MSPSNNDDQITAIMASTTTFEGAATRSRTKEVKRKQLEQATGDGTVDGSDVRQPTTRGFQADDGNIT